MNKKKYLLIITTILFVFLVLAGCRNENKPGLTEVSFGIKSGQSQEILSERIGSEGGKILVKQDSTLSGMEIQILEGSYPQDISFTITSSEILDHDFGTLFNPMTPLISVENGEVYAENTLFVTVPLKKEANEIAAGFYYNNDTHSLEGIPSVYQDQEKIILATNHFSNIVVSSASKDNIDKAGDALTGFEPGTDDFIFKNYGSFITPVGHCSGQSVSMLWYYKNIKLKGGENLFGLLDDNGEDPTPDFQFDDTLLYRFVSTVHMDANNNNHEFSEEYCNRAADMATVLTTNSQDELQFYAMKYAMLLVKRPQLVIIFGSNSEGKKSGHAVVAYKIEGNKIYIADPNYPGQKDRIITIDSGSFSVYNSGDNATAIAEGKEIAYKDIFWSGEFAITNEEKITERWQEVERKDLGNDLFPYPEIEIIGGVNQIQKSLEFSVTLPPEIGAELQVRLYLDKNNTIDLPYYIYRSSFVGNSVQNIFRTEDIFKEGKNTIGFYIHDSNNEWYDFQWIDIYVDSAFKLAADKDAYQTGETATIRVIMPGGAEVPDMQFFLASDQSKILFSGKEFKYRIPENSAGTIRVSCKEPQSGEIRSIDLVITGDRAQDDLEFVSAGLDEYYLDKSNRLQGEYRQYYDADHLKVARVTYYKDNVQNGKDTFYYKNGSVTKEGMYEDGKMKGLWTSYYDNGQKSVEEIFVQGLRQGIQKTWYKDGVLSSESNYVDDKRDGEMKNYYSTGELNKVTVFDNGVITVTTKYNKDGSVIKTIN